MITDQLVCEVTGRYPFADDTFERVRKALHYYNAECLYENNKKGFYSYMARHNNLYLLADYPEFLKDRLSERVALMGNSAKGYPSSLQYKNYAILCIRDWLTKPYTFTKDDTSQTIPLLFTIPFRALLQELAMYTPEGANADRVDGLRALMILREEKLRLFNPELFNSENGEGEEYNSDPFFKIFDKRKSLEDIYLPQNLKKQFRKEGFNELFIKTPDTNGQDAKKIGFLN